MPIAQERLIALAASADALLTIIDELKEFTRALRIRDLTLRVNSQEPAAQVLPELAETLAALHYKIYEIEVSQRIRETIAREKAHFHAHAKKNEIKKLYQAHKRNNFITKEKPSEISRVGDTRPSVSYKGRTFFGTQEEVQASPEFAAYNAELEAQEKARVLLANNGYIPRKDRMTQAELDAAAEAERKELEELKKENEAKPVDPSSAYSSPVDPSSICGSPHEGKDGIIRHLPAEPAPPPPTGENIL
jgi:hypothetical protein